MFRAVLLPVPSPSPRGPLTRAAGRTPLVIEALPMKRLAPLLSWMLAATLGLAPLAPAAETPTERTRGEARAWEHETSDIPVLSRVRFGKLANGMRYAWMANPEPDRRCYIRMHVDVGSLAETEAERGMAHFLEHLAFNGSENFPAGTLVEWFQRHGMGFGADTNAVTSFGETIYMIDLPTAAEKSLREGLTVLRDFAAGLLLEPKEVEAEKGVIDGEERERDSAGARVMEETLERLYAGTRYPERLPIGTKAARDAFDAEAIRAFYRRWYRPENLTLLIVGDLEKLDPTKAIEETFGSIEPPAGPPASEPAIGKPGLEDRFFFLHEPEIPVVQLTAARVYPHVEQPDTRATWVEDLPLIYARGIVNLRFGELARKEGAPFLGASLTTANQLDVFEGESLSINCAPDRWEQALAFCEQELRRALVHGFQKAELEELRADMLRSLDEAVAREATQSSSGWMTVLLAAAEHRMVPTDAKTDREILKPAIEALTVERCHKALVESWSKGKLTLWGAGNLVLGDDAGDQLRKVWEASTKVDVAAGEKIETSEWGYASADGEPGKVRSKQHVEDLDLHLIEFENGVRLNVKSTDFKENQILIAGRLGEGRLSLELERQPLVNVTDAVFNQGGLGKHSEEDLRRVLAGKLASFGLGTDTDHFGFGGATTSSDLLLQFELICAYLSDPGWRDDGLRQYRKLLPRLYESLEHQHQGPLVRNFIPELFGGDPRYRYPEQDELLAIEMKDVRDWMGPQLAKGPLEITVIGDVDLDDATALAARTLGRLPGRRAAEPHADRRKLPPLRTGLRSTHTIDTQIPKSLVIVAFPSTDGIETTRRRNLGFLGTILNDRLRLEVRERLGVAYSPAANSQSSRIYPGNGMFIIQVMSDPDRVKDVLEAVLDVTGSLAENGTTEEEVERLREPLLAQLRDAKRSNGYWAGAVSEAQSRPESLDDIRSSDAFYAKLDGKPLDELAKKYLDAKRASILVVNPATAAGATSEAGSDSSNQGGQR